jgi:hypothetical protein
MFIARSPAVELKDGDPPRRQPFHHRVRAMALEGWASIAAALGLITIVLLAGYVAWRSRPSSRHARRRRESLDWLRDNLRAASPPKRPRDGDDGEHAGK